jgi:hypothetical protein
MHPSRALRTMAEVEETEVEETEVTEHTGQHQHGDAEE